MRVLLDESVPRQLGPLLTGHAVTTVPREGWAGISNGDLIRQASERFDALITGDQSLQHQQVLSGLDLGIIVLVAPNNRVETITALAPRILDALRELSPGQVVQVATQQGAAADTAVRAVTGGGTLWRRGSGGVALAVSAHGAAERPVR